MLQTLCSLYQQFFINLTSPPLAARGREAHCLLEYPGVQPGHPSSSFFFFVTITSLHHHLLQSQATKTYPSAWPVLFAHKDQQPCPSYIDLSQHEFHAIKCAIPLSQASSIKTRFLKFICHSTCPESKDPEHRWEAMGGHWSLEISTNIWLGRYSITEVWIVSENKYSRPFESNSYHISMKHFWWCSAYRTIWVIYGIEYGSTTTWTNIWGQMFRNGKWFLMCNTWLSWLNCTQL